MRRFIKVLFQIALIFFVISVRTMWAEEPPLSLKDAVRMALGQNDAVKIGTAEVEEAVAYRKSARGRFGPIFQAEGNMIRWNKEFELDPHDLFHVSPRYEGIVELMMGPLDPITVREQQTKQFSLTMIQPITPMYSVYQGYSARSHGETATRKKFENTRQETVLKTIEAYLRLMKAKEFEKIAEAAEKTVQAHLDQLNSFERAEFVGRNEILMAQIEKANITELLIRARSSVGLARAALANIVGLSVNAEFEIEGLPAETSAVFDRPMTDAQENAVADRNDLAALQNKTMAMKSLSKLAWWQLTPQIAAVGRWEYQDGIALVDEEDYFVGLTLKWDFWEWGRTYYEAQAASAQARQAELKLHESANLIRLQVRQSYLEYDSARQRYETAKAAVAQAEENMRIQELRFAEGLSTTVDVMDAQTLLTRARGNEANAKYDSLTALATLRQVSGEDLEAGL